MKVIIDTISNLISSIVISIISGIITSLPIKFIFLILKINISLWTTAWLVILITFIALRLYNLLIEPSVRSINERLEFIAKSSIKNSEQIDEISSDIKQNTNDIRKITK